MSEINLEKARVELQERKDRLKANEHEREMERKRLEFDIFAVSGELPSKSTER